MRSRPFQLHRTLSDEGSPKGTLDFRFESRHYVFAGTKSPRYCCSDLPTGTYPAPLLKRRGEARPVLSTSQLTPLPGRIQEVPPKHLGRAQFFPPCVSSPSVVRGGASRLVCSWLLQWNDFLTFQQEFLHHANPPSRSGPASSFSFTASHRIHRSSRNRMNAAPEVEPMGSVTQRYPWRLL